MNYLLFVKSNGCPKCDTLKPHIPETVEKVYVDTEDGQAQAAFHDVYSVPMLLVFDGDGNELSAYNNVDKIKEELK